MIEAQVGFGETLRFTLAVDTIDWEQVRRSDKSHATRVDKILEQEFQRAREIVAADTRLLDILTSELITKGGISPEGLSEILASLDTGGISRENAANHNPTGKPTSR